MERWGEPDTLKRALDALWDCLINEDMTAERIEDIRRAVEAAAPDTDQFTSLFTGPALETVIAVAYALECYRDNGVNSAVAAAQAAINAIDAYVNMVDHPNPAGGTLSSSEDPSGSGRSSTPISVLKKEQEQFDQWIRQHPLMVAELRGQQQDIALLARHDVLQPGLIHGLRESARLRGIQPFARGFFGGPRE